MALSFVQRPEDVAEARRLIAGRAGVLVKLEKPAAIERLDELIELADAVMVARGDLGVEMPPEDVPPLQKRIIAACREAGKPVVVATQMLESMVHAPAPTRAEASDVATAVYDGADAVMLSAETASGEYPLEAVDDDEPHHHARGEGSATIAGLHPRPASASPRRRRSDAISAAAAQVAHTLSARRHRHLHHLGLDHAARRARAAGRADARASPSGSRRRGGWRSAGAPTACRPRTSADFSEMVDKACRIAREQGIADEGPAPRRHRRRALRHARLHQRAAHRLGGGLTAGGGSAARRNTTR